MSATCSAEVDTEYPDSKAIQEITGTRTSLSTPLLREGIAIGAIHVRRNEVRPFSENQIALLETFADQAVIAIENARLFQERETRNRDLSALHDVTAAASRSLEIKPVLDEVLEKITEIFKFDRVSIFLFDPKRETLTRMATFGIAQEETGVRAFRRGQGLTGKVAETGQYMVFEDVRSDPRYRQLSQTNSMQQLGACFFALFPIKAKERFLGTINCIGKEPRKLKPDEIRLINSMCDQIGVAVENINLFEEVKNKTAELESSNSELREALEQQTATSEILRVIASSPTELEPVLDVLLANAVKLSGAKQGHIRQSDGEFLRVVAHYNESPERITILQSNPLPLNPNIPGAQAFLERRPIHLLDAQVEAPGGQFLARQTGVRTLLGVPLLREGTGIGTITIWRDVVEPFTERQIELVKTFADQAVIAIENVRLFKELQERNRELTEALEQQTATGEVLRVIASSPTELQPVLDSLLANAVKLSGATKGHIRQLDGESLQYVGHFNESPDLIEALHQLPQRTRPEGMSARALREKQVVHILDAQEVPTYRAPVAQAQARTMLIVPLLREETGIGTITIWRDFVESFTERQIDLVKTFADQAVIAIENVRLFQELTEALEQQTATSEILGVIASSPTDIQPVLDVVAENAARLCGANDAVIRLVEGNMLRSVAHHGSLPQSRPRESEPLDGGWIPARAVLERQTIHIHDIAAVENEFPESTARAKRAGVRTMLTTPLLREGIAIGVIHIRRTEVRPFTDKQIALLKTFADQAVIAIENVRLFKEIQERNAELREALEHQTATAEVLGIISRSPTDVQPVLDAIVESAARVCGIDDVLLRLREDNMMVSRAHFGPIPSQRFEISIDEPQVRWMREHGTLHIPDVRAQNDFPMMGVVGGFRTFLAAPLGQQEELVGLLNARRTEVRPFTPAQIKLLETFADQAVIAIENVRLFNELKELLEQQTATSEILRVIASSPTAIQPVLDVIAGNAARICGTSDVSIIRVEGDAYRVVAAYGFAPNWTVGEIRPLDRGSVVGRAIVDRQTIHIHDVRAVEDDFWRVKTNAVQQGLRTMLAIPLMREGIGIGAIGIRRTEVRPFTDKQIALLKTFADQAVIAIENVRLFNELDTRNRQLTEALEQLTATSEILRVIASSPTDIQPVLDVVAENAARLCDAVDGVVGRREGDELRIVAKYGAIPSPDTVPLTRGFPAGRAVLDRQTIHIHDILTEIETEYPDARIAQQLTGTRTVLNTPLLREGVAIGYIAVRRTEVRPFTEKQIALLKTFADQAVIAIENVRLFQELETRTRELARSVGELKALGEVGQAVSSTLDLQTVLNTIVARAVQLSGTDCGIIYEYDEPTQEFHLQASYQMEEELVNAYQATPLRLGEGATGRAAETRTPTQIADLRGEQEFATRGLRPILSRLGYQSLMAVPLLLDQKIMGALTIYRRQPGSFAPEIVNLPRQGDG